MMDNHLGVGGSWFGRILGCLILGVVTGCASTPSVMLGRAIIRNATAQRMTDVRVLHKPTNRIGAVTALLPGRELDLGFPRQAMLATHGDVSWTDGDDEVAQAFCAGAWMNCGRLFVEKI